MAFKKAVREAVKLKIGLTGPSGSGKTMSALKMAKGIGKKIAFIDTENRSASLYADRFNFDCIDLKPPYNPEKYIQAMIEAITGGYDVLIMDSISHAWAGSGGILDTKNKLDQKGGNSFVNWGKMTPVQENFVSAILQANIHLICPF